MSIEVTSVSKKEQKLSRTSSAVFVISQEDIQRSGATNIPDLLRMVPGLDVAQLNGSTWSISSRGLNAQFANKLLVLIDGRTVYSPLFGGVYWDVQDVPLEDISRIEVIRGPGASVWGANAVNGVINITTKSAKETQGGLLTAGSGTHEKGFGVAQYGGAVNSNTDYRVFFKGFDRSSFPDPAGQSSHDQSDLLHGGFRVDSKLSEKDSLTVQGDLYNGSEGEIFNAVTLTPPYTVSFDGRTALYGGDVLGRWDHAFSANSSTTLQVYFDRTGRNDTLTAEGVDTYDVDFQHHFNWGSRNDVVWGLGYRDISYDTTGSFTFSFSPSSQGRQLFSSFVQDEIALKPDHVYLTIGAKLEHNDFTGFEFQPSARIAWSVNKNHTLWAGYARARRTPSSLENEVVSNVAAFAGPGGVPVLASVLGSPEVQSENLDAFEAGYRTQVHSNLSLDIAAFYNRYGDLSSIEPGTPTFETSPAPPHLDVPSFFANGLYGETHGLELAVNWKVANRWTLSPGYAFEEIHLHKKPTSGDTSSAADAEGDSPQHQAQLRSNVILPRRFEWNVAAYFEDRLPAQHIPAYTRLDTGLTWHAYERLEVSVVGQNLVQDHHLEVVSDSINPSSLIKRSFYVKFTWKF